MNANLATGRVCNSEHDLNQRLTRQLASACVLQIQPVEIALQIYHRASRAPVAAQIAA
jgi:hypothetical protein